MESEALNIIYRDEHLIAVNKPNGLLVHRSSIAAGEDVFAMQLLRDQIGRHVFPAHRLDRKTSGVLLFALDAHSAALLHDTFVEKGIEKKYLAIVRGYFPEAVELDYPLTNDRGKKQEALTRFQLLKTTEVDVPYGKHQTSRYSLIEAFPETGRQHQIRKHCAHLMHPIIGDRPYGCNRQNKLFKEKWNMMTMLLHAAEIKLTHPVTGEPFSIQAPLNEEFKRVHSFLGF